MCGLGLVMSMKKKHTGQRAFDIYKKQDHRGKQGYGFISIDNGHIKQVFRSKDENSFKSALMKDNSKIILLHHRFPTSTKNVLGATHPIFVRHAELKFDYYIAHNGVITNAHALKTEHEKLGYEYNTAFREKTVAVYNDGRTEDMTSEVPVFNDSESLAIEISRHIEGLQDKINTRGAAAFIGIAVEKGGTKVDKIFFGKNKGRDLCVQETTKWYIVSSETGSDLEDLKLWQYKLETNQWYESDLPIDVAEPVCHVGFHNSFAQGTSTTSYDTKKLVEDVRLHEDLKNAYYTQRERDETGVPAGEFFTVLRGQVKYYVPMKYASKDMDRPLFADYEEEKEIPNYYQLDAKTRERLEELVGEYAKVENQIETMEQADLQGFYDDDFLESEIDRLKIRQSGLEDAISALNVDEEIVDELLAIYQELEQYGSVPSPYHLIED